MFKWRLGLLQQHDSRCGFLQGLEVIIISIGTATVSFANSALIDDQLASRYNLTC